MTVDRLMASWALFQQNPHMVKRWTSPADPRLNLIGPFGLRITDLLAIARPRPSSAGTVLSIGCAGLVSTVRRASRPCWETQIMVAGRSHPRTLSTRAHGPIVATQ